MTTNEISPGSALPEIGSPSFTPRLLSYVLAHPSLNEWEISPSLFSAILLALVVKKGGIVLDVNDTGVERTSRVVSEMSKIIFGLSTQHLSLFRESTVAEIVPKLSHTSFSSTSSSTSSYRQRVPPYHLHRDPSQRQESGGATRNDGQGGDEAGTKECEALIVTGLEAAESPVQIKLCDILTKKRIEVNGEMRRFEPLAIWVRAGSGKSLPSWVIDHFVCGLTLDCDDLELPPLQDESDLYEGPIIPADYLSTLTALLPYVHIRPPLAVHISNLLSAISSHAGLRTTFTQRAVRAFPEFVKAHRLLSGSFDLPPNYLSILSRDGHDGTFFARNQTSGGGGGKKGLGGGIGGVDSWAAQAGEEPSLARLSREALAFARANGDIDSETDEGGEEVDDPFCTPSNVQGVWKVLVTHRVRRRKERDEVMWLVKGSAAQAAAMGANTDKERERQREALEVDQIVDEILRTV
ncbi:hypothetical protein IAU59_007448 [Kwoniella sp. CBS 9459]